MEVVRPRAERADDESIALKSLVHRRRLVNAPHDRLEITDVECPRIEVAIPSHHVERVVIEHDLVDAVVLFHENREVSHLVDWLRETWAPDVALGVRRAFDQLSEFIPISLWPAHVSPALEDQDLRLFACQLESIAMQNAAMNDQVVAFVERQ